MEGYPRPSERPELYRWEQHSIIYNVPVLKSGHNYEWDQSILRPRILSIIKQFYEGGEMSQYQAYIYHVAAVEEPTLEAQKNGALSKFVLEPTAILSTGRSSAIAAASKLIKIDWEPTRTRWIVKQFVGDNC